MNASKSKKTAPAKKAESKSQEKKSGYDYGAAKDYVFNFIKAIIDKHGARLPASEEERAAATDIEKFMEEATGKKAIREPFMVSPVASIGAISLIGIIGFIILAFYYVNPIISLVLSALVFAYAIIQIFLYKGWFDFLWKQHESQNVYTVIDGGDKIDYTIVYSGHMDSSWNWTHSLKKPHLLPLKIAYFILGILALFVMSIVRLAAGYYVGLFNIDLTSTPNIIMTFLPLLFVPGLYYGATFLSWDKTIAAPGAMDNLTGVGASIFMGKYYRENPDKLPSNCRVIVAALGSEEAGLKGSLDFVKRHKDNKELLINPIVLNSDSLSDYDHFGVISGDLWQMTNFDPELIEISLDVYKSLGLKTQAFKNPVGGCDSTPFCKAGFPTVTLCAQNPVPSTYYHTKNDHYDRLDVRAIEKGLEGLVLISEKIHEKMKRDSK